MNNVPDPLSRLLSSWRVEPTPQADFRTGVQSRLQASRQDASWGSFARARGAWVACAFVFAGFAGAWAGTAQARDRVVSSQADAYVQAMDARAMAGP